MVAAEVERFQQQLPAVAEAVALGARGPRARHLAAPEACPRLLATEAVVRESLAPWLYPLQAMPNTAEAPGEASLTHQSRLRWAEVHFAAAGEVVQEDRTRQLRLTWPAARAGRPEDTRLVAAVLTARTERLPRQGPQAVRRVRPREAKAVAVAELQSRLLLRERQEGLEVSVAEAAVAGV